MNTDTADEKRRLQLELSELDSVSDSDVFPCPSEGTFNSPFLSITMTSDGRIATMSGKEYKIGRREELMDELRQLDGQESEGRMKQHRSADAEGSEASEGVEGEKE
ncbi:hypothetical protein JCM10207_005014 [Rhodosporidiobolus poonsookiae]